ALGFLPETPETDLGQDPSRMGLFGIARLVLRQPPPANQRRQGGTLQYQRRQDHRERDEDDEPPRRKRVTGSSRHRHGQRYDQGTPPWHPAQAQKGEGPPRGRPRVPWAGGRQRDAPPADQGVDDPYADNRRRDQRAIEEQGVQRVGSKRPQDRGQLQPDQDE